MALMLHVDLDANDWVGYQRSTDLGNQLPANPAASTASITSLARAISSGSLTTVDFSRYDSDRAKFGKGYISWSPSATVIQQIFIGTNLAGTNDSHFYGAGGTITGVVWARGDLADTWKLQLFKVTGSTMIASSAAVTLNGPWTKLTVTGTTSGVDSYYALVLERVTGTTTSSKLITGAMIVHGSTAPDYYNSGDASLLEDLTPYWMDGRWQSGFVKPHQAVAPLGKAELTLRNADMRFSPEYASGALYGTLLPNLLTQIADPDVGVWWTGWSDSWMPQPGPTRERRAVLSATDTRRFIARKLPVMQLYGVTVYPAASVIVSDILDQFEVPNTTEGVPYESGLSSTWGSLIAWSEFADGDATYAYADNTPYDFDAVKVIGDIMAAVQGKLWFTREGRYRIIAAQGDSTPATYNNIGALWMEAGYDISDIINQCEVIAHLRKLQIGGGPYTMWELDANITLTAGEVEEFRVYFTHSNEAKILAGAGGTFAITGTLSAGTFGTDVTAVLSETGAQSALLTLTNTTGVSRTVTAATVTATARAVQLREVSKTREDATSITANGTLGERLKFSYISQRSWAKRLAQYRVNRFKDPTYWIPWFTLHAEKHPTEAFRCYVGAPIYITDVQTNHAAYYAVIGEQHTVKAGVTDHRVRVYTEPIYETSVDDTPI